MSIEHARESLKQAVDSLAIGPGRVRERLERAALFITHIQSNDVPDEHLRRMLNGIKKDDLTCEPPLGVARRRPPSPGARQAASAVNNRGSPSGD